MHYIPNGIDRWAAALIGTCFLFRELGLEDERYIMVRLPRVRWTWRTAPGSVVSGFLIQATGVVLLSNSYSIGVSMPRLEWRRRRLWKISIHSKTVARASCLVGQKCR